MKTIQRMKRAVLSVVLALAMLVTSLALPGQSAKAAEDLPTMYNSLKEQNDGRQAIGLDANGRVIFVTKANLAKSSSTVRWCTVGWDITIIGNNGASTGYVANGGNSSFSKEGESQNYDGYNYSKYVIPFEDVATTLDRAKTNNVSATNVTIYFNAIVTARYGSKTSGFPYAASNSPIQSNGGDYLAGYVDGNGNDVGTVYHLNNQSNVNAICKKYGFSSASAESMNNNYRNLRYKGDIGTQTVNYYSADGSKLLHSEASCNIYDSITTIDAEQYDRDVSTFNEGCIMSGYPQKSSLHMERAFCMKFLL